MNALEQKIKQKEAEIIELKARMNSRDVIYLNTYKGCTTTSFFFSEEGAKNDAEEHSVIFESTIKYIKSVDENINS